MFILSLVIHVIFLYSIFDIYFKSPIARNVTPYQPQHHAAANRLVFVVVDGLRAESFVNYTAMGYLRSIANSNGRWGISNTQVPTESRPGHVALIAGFYEDPSAIFKLWKNNPMEFDTTFNRTTYTWSWGAHDTVSIITRGAENEHIFIDWYNHYNSFFRTDKDTTLFDAWVFNRVTDFFGLANNGTEVRDMLQNDKIVFFLHLLSTDMAGHIYKPNTPFFFKTLKHLDKGIQEIEQVIRNYYKNDERTTFLLTADHGMTNWGSHGSGDKHETETPYVIWGSGVQQTKRTRSDPDTLDMSLDHRLDVNQVDMAALMSTILSIPIPVNSIGRPVTGLLNMTLADRAKAIYSVSRQLANQYNKKRQDVESNALPMLYQPYKPFDGKKYDELISFTEQLLRDQKYEELIVLSEEIIDLSLSGLRYYQDYYQRPLLILVTLSFLGWTAWLLRVLAERKFSLQAEGASRNRINTCRINLAMILRTAAFVILIILGSYFVYAQNLPTQYYVYAHMPLLLWYKALLPINIWVFTLKQLESSGRLSTLCLEFVTYIIGTLALGTSFTHRWMLSIPLLGMGLWPFFSSTKHYLSRPMIILWMIGSLFLSAFAFIPVVGKHTFITLVLLSGFAWVSFIGAYIYCVLVPLKCKDEDTNMRERKLFTIQGAILLMALYNINRQAERFDRRTPVNYIDQAIAWVIAVISPIVPMLYSKRMVNRLTAINTSLITIYLMMSVAHEGLFMVALTIHVMNWILIELSPLRLGKVEPLLSYETLETGSTYSTERGQTSGWGITHGTDRISGSAHGTYKIVDCAFDSENVNETCNTERNLTKQDFRRAFFFILYIVVAFFGTGNIASLNSFEIRWVTCFVTSYQPVVITTLILLKTFAPFMMVGCGFVAVQTLTKAPVGCLNIIVLVYSNLIGIQLLYNVRNTGSWLEIGTSVSHFVIIQLITVFIVIINKTAKLLTGVSIASKIFKNKKK